MYVMSLETLFLPLIVTNHSFESTCLITWASYPLCSLCHIIICKNNTTDVIDSRADKMLLWFGVNHMLVTDYHQWVDGENRCESHVGHRQCLTLSPFFCLSVCLSHLVKPALVQACLKHYKVHCHLVCTMQIICWYKKKSNSNANYATTEEMIDFGHVAGSFF